MSDDVYEEDKAELTKWGILQNCPSMLNYRSIVCSADDDEIERLKIALRRFQIFVERRLEMDRFQRKTYRERASTALWEIEHWTKKEI